MIIGIVVFIFCCIGIYGFYTNLLFLTYIGLALSLIEQIIGIITGQQKGLGFIPLCLIISIGGAIAGNNFLKCLAIVFCYENVLVFILGIPFAITNYKKIKQGYEETK